MISDQYTIDVIPPENPKELWGVWCKELKLSAFGETESEAFYNLVENIPEFLKIQKEADRTKTLRNNTKTTQRKRFTIPAFA